MTTSYNIDAELVAIEIADRVVKGSVLVQAIENVIEVKLNEAFVGDTFANAIGTIVETKVAMVFDNHMGELRKSLFAINNRLAELESK